MAQASETYPISSQYVDCHVIPKATDKPLELSMKHDQSIVLIVNKGTGDICAQHFINDTRTAQDRFYNAPLRILQQDIFLEQPGEKVAFIFNTDHGSPNILNYLAALEAGGVEMGGRITAAVREYFRYEEFKHVAV